MRILIAITALCVFVLLWAAYAIWRHIAAGVKRSREEQPEVNRAPLYEFEAELQQQLRSAHAAAGFFRSARPAPATAQTEITSTEANRKPPVSINGETMNRLDWTHFSNDLGDLSDPYQIPRYAANGSSRQNRN